MITGALSPCEKALGRGVAPCGFHSLGERCLFPRFEMNCGCAAPSPGAEHRLEDIRLCFYEVMLLLGRKLDHSTAFIGIAQRRKNFASYPKIGMIHVRAFLGFGKRERDLAKIFRSHRRGSGKKLTLA
jgi:hypothetical protein